MRSAAFFSASRSTTIYNLKVLIFSSLSVPRRSLAAPHPLPSCGNDSSIARNRGREMSITGTHPYSPCSPGQACLRGFLTSLSDFLLCPLDPGVPHPFRFPRALPPNPLSCEMRGRASGARIESDLSLHISFCFLALKVCSEEGAFSCDHS